MGVTRLPVDPDLQQIVRLDLSQADGYLESQSSAHANARCLGCGMFMMLPVAELRASRVGVVSHHGYKPDVGPYEPCGGAVVALDIVRDVDDPVTRHLQ